MLFNKEKCKVMHYGKGNSQFMYHIRGYILATCCTYKDLGVTISKDLKAAHHIEKCVNKANMLVGMIKRTYSYIDEDIFLKTYKTFVRPVLEYC